MRASPDGTPLVDRVVEEEFPLDALLAAAERASLGDPNERPALLKDLSHTRPEFRYWAAAGLARLAQTGRLDALERDGLEAGLLTTLADTNDEVASQAAAALVFAGRGQPALDLLVALTRGGSGAAASTLETLGERIRPVVADLQVPPTSALLTPLLCMLGVFDYADAYGAKARDQGLKVNRTRRDWTRPAPRGGR